MVFYPGPGRPDAERHAQQHQPDHDDRFGRRKDLQELRLRLLPIHHELHRSDLLPRVLQIVQHDLAQLDLRLLTLALESRAVQETPRTPGISQITASLLFPVESQAKIAEKRMPALLEGARITFRQPIHQHGAAETVIGNLLGELEFAFNTAHVERQGKEVRIRLAFKTDLSARIGEQIEGVHKEAVAMVRQAEERQLGGDNLKQLAIAMLKFADDHGGELPPAAILSKDGKHLLSWRVAILPYLEEDDLYRQFKLDEPWTSPHNLKLLEKMPKVFASPREVEGQKPFTTFYQVFVGPKTEASFELARKVKLPGDFPDGTTSTFLIVEAKEPVPWTKPEDIPYSSKGLLPKLGGIFSDGFNAAMADGSVRFIKRTTSENTLRALITPAGGDEPGDDWQK